MGQARIERRPTIFDHFVFWWAGASKRRWSHPTSSVLGAQHFLRHSFEVVQRCGRLQRANLKVVPDQSEDRARLAIVEDGLAFPKAATRTLRRIISQSSVTLTADQAKGAGLILRQLVFEASSWRGNVFHHDVFAV